MAIPLTPNKTGRLMLEMKRHRTGQKMMWCGMSVFMLAVHLLPIQYFWMAYPSAFFMILGCILDVFDR